MLQYVLCLQGVYYLFTVSMGRTTPKHLRYVHIHIKIIIEITNAIKYKVVLYF